MTDQEWQDLGRRAVACKHWRWLPGMLARYSGGAWYRTGEVDTTGTHGSVRPPNPRSAWPDIRDAATLGCLLALVREAWPNVVIWVARDCAVDPLDDAEYMLDDVEGWTVCGGCGDDYVGCFGSGKTEADALVAALEAAP